MKNAILLILVVWAILNIAGCVKAKRDYQAFADFHNSAGGMFTDFMTGFVGGQNGDPFGPALNTMGEGRSLEGEYDNCSFWAWVWTGIAVLVIVVTKAGTKPTVKK